MWLRSVDACQAPQPAEHVADVRAEHAAVDVRLVDDDVTQVVQHVGPQVVSRQHADVQHVGVREHEVRPLADLRAALGRRVAVVDRSAHVRHGECGKRARLILRECFSGVEVERSVLRLARERVEHGEVEGQGLAGRGAGRDDQVAATARHVPGFSLVRVELGDPLSDERVADRGVNVCRERHRARGARRHGRQVGELVALKDVLPRRFSDHGVIEPSTASAACRQARAGER